MEAFFRLPRNSVSSLSISVPVFHSDCHSRFSEPIMIPCQYMWGKANKTELTSKIPTDPASTISGETGDGGCSMFQIGFCQFSLSEFLAQVVAKPSLANLTV